LTTLIEILPKLSTNQILLGCPCTPCTPRSYATAPLASSHQINATCVSSLTTRRSI